MANCLSIANEAFGLVKRWVASDHHAELTYQWAMTHEDRELRRTLLVRAIAMAPSALQHQRQIEDAS